MAISPDQFEHLIQLIEDGELDDRMIDLRRAMDERNQRRRDDILKLVKSVWGEQAEVVTEHEPNPAPRRTDRPSVEYQPADGPQLPQGTSDPMSDWPSPIQSAGLGGGSPAPGPQPTFSPVSDPITGGGGSDPLGDNNPDILSTGAQIGPPE